MNRPSDRHPKCVCGRPLRNNAKFCRECEQWARIALAAQTGYSDELHTELVKLTRKQPVNEGGGSTERPLPFSPHASILIKAQIRWLSEWWTIVDQAVPAISGPPCPACTRGQGVGCRRITDTWRPDGSIHAVAGYLTTHLAVIRRHPDGARFITTLRALTGRIVRLIDAPENRTHIRSVGPCPETVAAADDPNQLAPCTGHVEVLVKADETLGGIMHCTECRAEWKPWQWERASRRIIARAEQLARQKQLAQAIIGGTAA